MIRIAVDAMGGDFAPESAVKGVNLAIAAFDNIEVLLFGDQDKIRPYLEATERVEIIHTPEKINGDDEPVRAIRKKKNASMVLAAQAVKEGQADALLSAGNTGALLASGLLIVGRIKNIDRPGLMPVLPTASSQHPYLVLMDAGANADCKPVNLLQFAVLANFYAQRVLGIAQPKIGLLNNGTEATKGNELSKAAYELLAAETSLDFYGNVETKTLLDGQVDIVVTDGFTGNAVLKTLEGTSKTLFSLIKSQLLGGGLKAKLGALLVKDALSGLRDNFDDTKQGGAVLLGVKAPVIKAHGSSNEQAIFNAIRQARTIVESGIIQEATDYFGQEKPAQTEE
ncbi:phosphate acyltransferase PlsX [Abiotrophia sp. HMSC24B09]|uniref:phosphate acyltransferase PlsX n=1 Tax=Abiotrophia sp. HMSC24B09 TaxID=1581061 RepID=UPI0008A509F0|nr:phosphate acyltransferase PlsX [Abiotrophia sp. HMSC24B09]OFS30112.1 phosphate acyltransferase [Abiotrophia sp. HMSC24B09]